MPGVTSSVPRPFVCWALMLPYMLILPGCNKLQGKLPRDGHMAVSDGTDGF